ncbi:ribosomal L27 protein-domain-containing protein [Sphaerosporella brunnea]|uniref:Large ribosomal subunit protein bL27m n=1 Tax=Sphaerosporella brunnea TaxID=1250544 RepID=A0A5J5F2Q8_9PEZI|nr:ribosomal L27 protein-domain-containing protein [Sphaerosporella brunnea]
MFAPRIFSAFRAAPRAPILRTALLAARPRTPLFPAIQSRPATHAAAGRANKAKDGPGKRLGAKKTAGEKVKTGMIIYRQRGTVWYPGENAGMGRDHTIFAAAPGYVRYYKDPAQPKRKFIGIALTEKQVLPSPPHAIRVRRLGMKAVPLEEEPRNVPFGTPLVRGDQVAKDGFYAYRTPNWRIGRMMPKVEVKNNNPFARWQKKGKRNAAWKRRKGIA